MNSNDEIMDILDKLKDEKNLSISEIARRTDTAKSSVSRYFNRTRQFPLDKINEFAKAFNVKPEFLLGVDSPSNIIEIKQVQNVPVISSVACGQPIFAEDNYDDSIPYSVDLLPSGKVFFVKAVGDSMEPTIKPDELVLVREQEVVENGEIACVVFEDEGSYATLKRLRKQDGRVMLIPDNTDYMPYELKEDDNVRILGKAMFVINEL